MNEQRSWYDALDLQLARRLIRPMVQPGVIDARMARVIIARSQSLNNRLPLFTQLQRRGVTATSLKPGQIPIVYAQLLPRDAGEAEEVGGTKTTKPPVVQAKFARPSSSSVNKILPVESSLPIEQNSKFSVPQIQRKIDGHQTQKDGFRGLSANPTDNSSISPSPSPVIEQAPIIYTQSLLSNSSSTSDTFEQPNIENSQVSQLPVVQAKFDTKDTPSLYKLSLPVVQINDILTPQLTKKQQENNVYSLSHNESVSSISSVRNPLLFNFLPSEVPIVSAQSLEKNLQQSAHRENKLPVVPIIPNLNSLSSHQLDPLVFSITSANTFHRTSPISPTKIEANSYQMALRQANQTDTNLPISRAVEPTNKTTVSQPTATNGSQPITGVQINRTINSKAHPQQTVDLDVLADKVERKLMRRLVVESERRGQKQWR